MKYEVLQSIEVFPIPTVYFPYRSPFVLRSSSVHPPFILRSSSVRAPFILRSSSVRSPFVFRSAIEDRSKNDRRTNGDSSEARRRCIETLMRNQEKDDSNKNFIFNHLNSNYYGNFFNEICAMLLKNAGRSSIKTGHLSIFSIKTGA